MILDIIRQSWAESPTRTLLAIPAAVAVVLGGWVLLVLTIVTFS